MSYLGIDLGTTYSLAALLNDQGKPVLVPDFHDANVFRTPSVVYIGEHGCLVGDVAEALLEEQPSLSHARCFKLDMATEGAGYSDHQQRRWWPQSLSALVLKKLLQDVAAFVPEAIEGALITVPASFTEPQRNATKEAAQLAGIAPVKLIEEPIAAATFYGINQTTEQTLFVYDLGGGTFDATILQSGDQGLYVLATAGSTKLGGAWLDQQVVQLVQQQYTEQFGACDFDDGALQRMRRFAVDAKMSFSKPGKNRVQQTLLLMGQSLDMVLLRSQFEQLVADIVAETVAICQQCLQQASMDWDFIDVIMLTGGSSLLPLVAEQLQRQSGKAAAQLVCKQPHQAVAYGAAIIAAQSFVDSSGKTVSSRCPYGLGIRLRSDDAAPKVHQLIAANSAVPVQAKARFRSHRADQQRLMIEVMQLPEGELPQSLGFFAFAIAAPRKGYVVEISLGYDLDGAVTVTALGLDDKQQLRRVLQRHDGALSAALQQQQQWLLELTVNG
ncbi:Hsp70 family protein [Ferrimonas senticii]|uniref:Hsp70 family protein n=1 Tax=Ferrimonas senticii TaxID=394566 RepID=UPI0004062C3A|nr:Hsp70 family protein [Ferrimonas senticii]